MVYHQAVRLAENVYCYLWQGRGNNCNSILLASVLRGKKPHVLIDPGHIRNELGEACFESLVKAMEGSGFTIKEVGLVIGTHSHPDHVEAARLITVENGALFALSREEDDFYRNAGKRFFEFLGAPFPQLSPFFYLKEGDLVLGAKDNKVSLRVLLTPGHSPGSVSLYIEEKKILVSGDVVFAGSMGRTDFPGGSPSLLRKSIERLAELDVECLVPGHSTEMGSIVMGKERVKRNFYTLKMFI